MILLLVSANFLASEYVSIREMQRVLQRQDANEACAIAIVLQKVDWRSTPLGKLNSLPTYGRHIAMWSKRDDAFIEVAQGIRETLEVVLLLMVNSPEVPETAEGLYDLAQRYSQQGMYKHERSRSMSSTGDQRIPR